MQLIRGQINLPASTSSSGCVATFGNFDGVHLGHQALLKELNSIAKQLKLPTTLITFEPQPLEFFAETVSVARLTRWREKWLALASLAVDYFCCLRFNHAFAALSARDFVQEILVRGLGVRALVVGEDCRFGANRQGDLTLLRQLGEEFGFAVTCLAQQDQQDERISSTRIRKALEAGELKLAEQLLGRPYSLFGKVAYGHKRGQQWGFPTANIYLHRHLTPVKGVFVVRIDGLEKPYFGVANIGVRPTVDGTRVLLEVHLFDFSGNIYSHNLSVGLLYKLRDEIRFDSIELLKVQITKDVQQARAYLEI